VEKMSALANSYADLLSKAQPEVIHDECQYEAALGRLESLTSKERPSDAEKKLVELLSLLIDDFEAKHYSLPKAGPIDVIRHLMEENHLRQKDLVDVFGTESIVSDILNGKRDLTKEHIRKLSERFSVSPAVFF
jgi:HTH-type transcriptional regulator / antitoxin HigA